jgi:hypothetical protein
MRYARSHMRARNAISASVFLFSVAVGVPFLAGVAATPAEAKFKFKKFEISHATRGRPILVVRRNGDGWTVKNSDELFLDLNIHVKSGVAHRIRWVYFKFGGTSHTIYDGKKASNIKINGVRAALNGAELGYLRDFGGNFCKTAGPGLHPRTFGVQVAIVDSGGQAIWRDKIISGYVRCIG